MYGIIGLSCTTVRLAIFLSHHFEIYKINRQANIIMVSYEFRINSIYHYGCKFLSGEPDAAETFRPDMLYNAFIK
jgi:hypothetical protein